MVYLAEEGLRTEGRCFDHAWQVISYYLKKILDPNFITLKIIVGDVKSCNCQS